MRREIATINLKGERGRRVNLPPSLRLTSLISVAQILSVVYTDLRGQNYLNKFLMLLYSEFLPHRTCSISRSRVTEGSGAISECSSS